MSQYIKNPPLGTPLNKHHPLSKVLKQAYLLNEQGGLLAWDHSRNGNNGTLVNGTTRVGEKLLFDGMDDYIEIPSLGIFGNTQGWTVERSLNRYLYQKP